jgi:hypothetical protein
MTKKKLNTYTLEFKESADTLNAQKNQHYVEQPRRTSHDFLRKVRRGLF